MERWIVDAKRFANEISKSEATTTILTACTAFVTSTNMPKGGNYRLLYEEIRKASYPPISSKASPRLSPASRAFALESFFLLLDGKLLN